MKSLAKVCGIVAMPVIASVMVGCGDSTNLGQNVQVILDPTAQTAKIEVELTNGLQVSAAGDYLIQQNWGRVYFVDATKTANSKIGVEVSMAKIIGQQLNFGLLSSLPNGAPLPVAVTAPLFAIPVMQNANFDIKAALSLTPELQLGAVVGIKAFNSKYVIPGIALCQNFRNANNEAYAAVCLYGPAADNSTNGGIFIGGTFGNVIPTHIASAVPTTTNLSMRSAMFAMAMPSSDTASELRLPAINMLSAQYFEEIHDPKNKMYTSEGLKSLKNVQKVLKVK
jgi:hypothetical protein